MRKKQSLLQFLNKEKIKVFRTLGKGLFWFLTGGAIGLFFLVGITSIIFQQKYKNVIYPGIMINGIDFGGKNQEFTKEFFVRKNAAIEDTIFTFQGNIGIATISAKELKFGYNQELLAKQAYSIGRSSDPLANLSLILQAYIHGINLEPSYHYSEEKLLNLLSPIIEKTYISPVDALFTFKDGKVLTFRPSSDGQEVNIDDLKKGLYSRIASIVLYEQTQNVSYPIPIKILKPKVSTDQVNNLGIKELIASGTSLFQHSVQNRIFNITLAATRLNGILIPPGEVFSFNKALGDISAFTGYKQGYIIQNGRTVLGDGGGVCQVSTTLFRAALNAGLPIIERHAHAYRPVYYELDSSPGLDATIYSPSVDFKFKNDTNSHMLVITEIDPEVERLTFLLYGTKDNRKVTLNKPIMASQTAPPSPLYQDDATLAKGVIRQIDFEAWGANVYFTRQVEKNGKIIISDKFVSNYQPWRAVYLKGTKE